MSPERTFHKFIPFAKVDAVKREVWGIVTAEVPDKGGEICDYESTVPYYKAWSEEFIKATDGKSCGNLRLMHTMRAVGKGVGIEFRDADKEIWMGFRVTADDVWKDVEEATLTGFSQGGKYRSGPDINKRYTAEPVEVSLVDNPALGVCHFAFIRADGGVEMRKVRSEPVAAEVTRLSTVMPPVTVKVDMPAGAAVPPLDITALVRSTVMEWLNKGGTPGAVVAPKTPAPEAAPSIALLKSALDQVKKGMYDVAQFAGLIDALAWLQRMAEFERESEGDESTVPAELLALIAQLCQNFLAMAAEETGELITRPGLGEVALFATQSKLRKASTLLTKAAEKIQKQGAGQPAERTQNMELEKKATAAAHIAKAKQLASDSHDKLQAQLDKCAAAAPDDDKTEKAAAPVEKTALAPATAVAPAAIADFEKRAEDAIVSMTAQFTTFMDRLSKTLEAPKAVQADPAAGRVVTKAADAGGVATETTPAAPAVPAFVPLNSGAPVDPKVRDAMKALRGAALGE